MWENLNKATITLTPIIWQNLTSKEITVTPKVITWQKLVSKNVTITPKEIPPVVWVKLASKTITLSPIGVPPVPPEEKKFPWAPVIIVGGALVAIMGLAAVKGVK